MATSIVPGKRGKKSRRVRLEDIAEKVGVSLSTVSRAIAGEKGVRADIRQRILEAAKDINYAVPTPVAGKKVVLAASSAAMIDYVRNQFTLYVLEGLRDRAQALGLDIVTRAVADEAEEKVVLEEARTDPDVAGLLFLTVDDEGMLAATRGFGKPVVLINGDDPTMRLSSVTPCNRSAAHLAADYLIRLGHSRILFLMRPGRRTIDRRREGWQDALLQHGLPCPADLVVPVDDWLPELAAQAIGERIRTKGLDFTAVLTAGDSLAVGAMMGVQQAGYSVPGDVSVMGMDDLPQAAFLNPPLTTMHIPMRELGSVALDLLRDDMSGFSVPPRRVELACHIAERQSTGPAKRRQA
ncbi:LacI family DNA-binding transcriptional regulator [Neorhizobium sp. CSC1952]|uniref:Transcriptional regulator, LacI family n=1 Tax=Xaviernesmea oryzae TaxID=464029 RepID=A0A1X7CET8_9HYPH|nr:MULTISPECIES: LacI family DNA-binding transcriptional regulator [Rhizobium/Agrobacterium group]WJR69384.1 LacI family DNA-binding transcriptional regulator [Rhizobium sp. CSC1952]SME95436.1 transcriptional regulator, LacI family [Xaviernesmea oryzae]